MPVHFAEAEPVRRTPTKLRSSLVPHRADAHKEAVAVALHEFKELQLHVDAAAQRRVTPREPGTPPLRHHPPKATRLLNRRRRPLSAPAVRHEPGLAAKELAPRDADADAFSLTARRLRPSPRPQSARPPPSPQQRPTPRRGRAPRVVAPPQPRREESGAPRRVPQPRATLQLSGRPLSPRQNAPPDGERRPAQLSLLSAFSAPRALGESAAGRAVQTWPPLPLRPGSAAPPPPPSPPAPRPGSAASPGSRPGSAAAPLREAQLLLARARPTAPSSPLGLFPLLPEDGSLPGALERESGAWARALEAEARAASAASRPASARRHATLPQHVVRASWDDAGGRDSQLRASLRLRGRASPRRDSLIDAADERRAVGLSWMARAGGEGAEGGGRPRTAPAPGSPGGRPWSSPSGESSCSPEPLGMTGSGIVMAARPPSRSQQPSPPSGGSRPPRNSPGSSGRAAAGSTT